MSYIIEKRHYPEPDNLAETHNIGPDTRFRIIAHLDFPFLEEKHGIQVTGHTIARRGNLFVRNKPAFSQVLVCCSGEAVVLIKGRWAPLYPGMAYITPINKRHAYFAKPGSPMEFSWVIYEGRGPESICDHLDKDEPYTVQATPNLLSYQLLGLYNESIHQRDELMMDAWVSLVNIYVRRALAGKEPDPRLRKLWTRVEEDFSAKWSCKSMAEIAGISEEHLRRLCHRIYAQSPAERLRSLRIKYATELLEFSELSIEKIAEKTGYSDAAAFSRAFSNSQGATPSRYRRSVRLGR